LQDADVKRINPMALLINDSRALAAAARGMKQLVMTENEVKAITQPTLCVVGDRDPLCESVKVMEDQRPGLKIVYVKGAHHMNTFHLPIFREEIEQFLAQQRGK
jgi:pimeloyl-ACP methyl ester carboxylesterase